jgi:hypothetical protein
MAPPLPARLPLLVAFAIGALSTSTALAQQPVRPLPKVGGCPLGYLASGSYCVPGSPSNDREAIQKTGNSCPLGWFSSGSYCVKNR